MHGMMRPYDRGWRVRRRRCGAVRLTRSHVARQATGGVQCTRTDGLGTQVVSELVDGAWPGLREVLSS
jgi:hypothetical protein